MKLRRLGSGRDELSICACKVNAQSVRSWYLWRRYCLREQVPELIKSHEGCWVGKSSRGSFACCKVKPFRSAIFKNFTPPGPTCAGYVLEGGRCWDWLR